MNFSHESKKKRDAHECSKELQKQRTPPLCRCTDEDASKRNPHWRAGCSRSSAKFLRKKTKYIYKLCICRECSAAAAGITRTRVADSAQRISQATLMAHAAQGTGSRALTMVGFLSLSRIKKTSERCTSLNGLSEILEKNKFELLPRHSCSPPQLRSANKAAAPYSLTGKV